MPCVPGQSTRLAISIELNGQAFDLDGETTCRERRSTRLLILHALAR